jgi:hypothetical protein
MTQLPNIDPNRRNDLYLAVQYICDTFSIAYNSESAEHMMVFLEALRIYDERNNQYGPLWKNAGAAENFFDASRKARRVKAVVMSEGGFNIDDDALDAINYLIFGIRNMREGRIEEVDDGLRKKMPPLPQGWSYEYYEEQLWRLGPNGFRERVAPEEIENWPVADGR